MLKYFYDILQRKRRAYGILLAILLLAFLKIFFPGYGKASRFLWEREGGEMGRHKSYCHFGSLIAVCPYVLIALIEEHSLGERKAGDFRPTRFNFSGERDEDNIMKFYIILKD